MTKLSQKLILSLFPGIGLLDRAFEEKGFCVVRGPDLLWGGDIRQFHPPYGKFWGVIGGPPCQDFSGLRRCDPTGNGVEMLKQYARCVTEVQPEWWLMENVARVPNCDIPDYVTQRFDINQGWYCDVSRLRHIQFGSKSGRLLNVTRQSIAVNCEPAAVASDDRPFSELCRLQGLPDGFDLPGFLAVEKKKAVGNGVPLVMGTVLAQAVIDAYSGHSGQVITKRCLCGCGRQVTGKAKYAANLEGNTSACRKRAQRNRDQAPQNVTL